MIEYYCYTIDTYWSYGQYLYGTDTTTQCFFRIIPDESGADDNHPGGRRGGGGGGKPGGHANQEKRDCAEQDFSLNGGSGFTGAELAAIAQTAVGEASNDFYPGEVEYVFATVINRQTINLALHAALGNSRLNVFKGGASIIELLSASRQYQAHTEQSGQRKLIEEKANNNGRLPAGYVCDQLKAVKNFARLIASGVLSREDLLSRYPFTYNLGKNRTAPGNAFYIDPQSGVLKNGVYRVGDTIFFNLPYRF
ncbi:MAG: hypothetical protein C4287_22995 [Leptolyngbya sp. ERB_1_2]